MPHLSRREFLTGAAASAPAILSCGRSKPERPPNIVFIMADDLGYGDLGCYGQRKIRTPNIDRLAAEGMKFTDAYAGCTVCAPSRSVLMTGLHMGHTSVRANTGGVPLLAEDVTVAELLKPAGYATGCFGKWGLGDIGTDGVPWKQGFDEFFGYLHQVHAHYYYPRFLYKNGEEFPLPGNENGGRGTYSHDVIAGQALDFIRRNKDRPFFCYIPFTIPHLELLVPEDSLREYLGKFPEPEPRHDPRGHYADQPAPRAAFAAMITRMDRDVGRILHLLKELAIDEQTLVIFTSDNGGMFPALDPEDFFRSNAGLRGHKRDLYEGGIRVPFLARWPGHVPPGSVTHFQTAFWDFLPTALDLAGLDVPPHADGESIRETLLGGEQRRRHEFLYWELPRYNAKTGKFAKETPRQAARWRNWKVVRPKPDGPLELYDLAEDPGETRDLAAEKPEILAKFEEYLQRARYDPRPQTQPPHDWWTTR